MKRALIALALLGAAKPHAIKVNPDAAMITKAKAAVADKLRDPSSAQFRNLRVRRGEGMDGRAVCGEVNAKNGFGGYAGFEPFVYQSAFNDVAMTRDDLFPVYSADC